MRDPERISKYCRTLQDAWSQFPDWRFGQFVINLINLCADQTGRDPFFVEDGEMFEFIRDYFMEGKHNAS